MSCITNKNIIQAPAGCGKTFMILLLADLLIDTGDGSHIVVIYCTEEIVRKKIQAHKHMMKNKNAVIIAHIFDPETWK